MKTNTKKGRLLFSSPALLPFYLPTFLLFLYLLMPFSIHAAITADAKPEKESVMLAEPLQIICEIELPLGLDIDLSSWKNNETSFGNFVLKKFDLKKEFTDNTAKISLLVTVMPFKIGVVKFPSLEIPLTGDSPDSNTAPEKLATTEITITVADPTLKSKKPDEIRDIRVPRRPLYFWERPAGIASISFLALLLLLLAMLFLLRKRKRRLRLADKMKEEIPPEEEFLLTLTRLENQGLLEARRYREFYFPLSEAFRVYLDRKFDLETEQMTKEELYHLLNRKREELGIDLSLFLTMKNILEVMDLAKFAKHEPSPHQNSNIIATLRNFVESHRHPQEDPANAQTEDKKSIASAV